MRGLGIIVARSGSKRLVHKNITMMNGHPMLAYSCMAAKSASSLTRVIISTDSPHYAQIAQNYGVEVPFLRPDNLAQDDTSSESVIEHALLQCPGYDFAVLLQATSPLRTSDDIEGAIALYRQKNADIVYSITDDVKDPRIYRTMNQDGTLEPYILPHKDSDSLTHNQKLYRLNGAIYVFSTKFFLQNGHFRAIKSYGYYMPPERSVDIDSMMDLTIALSLMENAKNA